jgi:hypothetical protein
MNRIFNVINKNNNEKYEVFDIVYNSAGYPHFLVYKDGQWLRMSAKYFRPITVEDLKKELGSFNNLVLETF